MKKYMKLTPTVISSIREKANKLFVDSSIDLRNTQDYITSCYTQAILDEQVKQGILKFEHNSMNKVEYFIVEGLNNGSNETKERTTTGNTNKD